MISTITLLVTPGMLTVPEETMNQYLQDNHISEDSIISIQQLTNGSVRIWWRKDK